jgi:hypothetical protein
MLQRILALATILLASSAAAWDKEPGSGLDDCNFRSRHICFYDFTTDGVSPMLDTRECENWSAHFLSDVGATTHDSTVQIRWSLSPTVNANTSEVVDNITLDGDPAASTDSMRGYDSPWIYVDTNTGHAGGGDISRISVQCFPWN